MSFGSSATGSSAAGSAPGQSGGGFSFGSGKDGASSGSTASAASGFNFGGSATEQKKDGDASSTKPGEKSSTTGQTSTALTFGGTSTAGSGSGTGAGQAPVFGGSGKSEAEKRSVSATAAALELNGKSIEEIVTTWQDTLQRHVDQFVTAALAVRKRDNDMLENQKRITQLAKDAQILKQEHTELRWNLDTVTELQYDLHTSLEQVSVGLEWIEAVVNQNVTVR